MSRTFVQSGLCLQRLSSTQGDEEGKDLQKRVEAIDVVIDAEMAELNVLNGENQQLKDDIEILNNAFAQAAHVAAGGV